MKSNKIFFYISALLFSSVLLATSCSAQHRITGNGNIQTQSRSANNFTRIDCSGSFTIFLTQANSTGVKIETDENLFPYIITEVKGDKLVLKTKKGVNIKPSKSVKVYLTMKNIEALNVSGASKIQSQNMLQTDELKLSVSGSADMNLQLKTNSLSTDISGAGKMDVKGNATSTEYHISGTADVKADDLVTDNTEVHISGTGKLHVNAQKKLDVSISGIGKVWYKGNPEVAESVSGMGKIAKE